MAKRIYGSNPESFEGEGVMPELARLVCEWCGEGFTQSNILIGDIDKYGEGGGVLCPHCWRFTNPNPKYWIGNKMTLLRIVCIYCKCVKGYKNGEGVSGDSHSICKKCWQEHFPNTEYPEENNEHTQG